VFLLERVWTYRLHGQFEGFPGKLRERARRKFENDLAGATNTNRFATLVMAVAVPSNGSVTANPPAARCTPPAN
jgi:hypothetical protein